MVDILQEYQPSSHQATQRSSKKKLFQFITLFGAIPEWKAQNENNNIMTDVFTPFSSLNQSSSDDKYRGV